MHSEFSISVPADVAAKIKKFFAIHVDWCKQPATMRLMPDQPDPNNRVLSVRISRELYRKLQIGSKSFGDGGFNGYVRALLMSKTDHIALGKEDYDRILREKEEYLANLKKPKKKKV